MNNQEPDKLERLFSEARKEEADIDLKKEIMNRIDPNKYAPKEKPKRMKITRESWNSPKFRTWFYVAAGVTVAALLFTLYRADFKPGREDADKMKGTFFSSGDPALFTTAETIMYQGWQMKASFRTRYSENQVEMYLDLASDDVIETNIEFDSNDFDFLVAVRQQVDDNTMISNAPDHVRVQSIHGNLIGIKLVNKNKLQHDITVKISQRGNPLYQGTVTINKQ